jgi:hypothetical protein
VKQQSAIQFLAKILASPKPVAFVRNAAKQAGLSWRTIERAKVELGVVSSRRSTGNRGKGGWVWQVGGITSVCAEQTSGKTAKRNGPVAITKNTQPAGVEAGKSNSLAQGDWDALERGDLAEFWAPQHSGLWPWRRPER